MHLSDGIIDNPALVIGLDLAAAGVLAAASREALDDEDPRMAWTGTLAAFVFAAQAINVPLLPGASAHALGAALLALTVGPARAIVALFAVLLVQALFLADGGLLVLGLNLINIAVLPVLAVHGARLLLGDTPRGLIAAAVVGTVAGNVLGAASLGATLVAGAGAPPVVTFGWLLSVQAAAGVIEGVLTAFAVRGLYRLSPETFRGAGTGRLPAPSKSAVAWTAVAVGLALAIIPLATHTPDALERVVELLHKP